MKKKKRPSKKIKIEFVDGDEGESMFDDCLACLDPKGELNLIERFKNSSKTKKRIIN